MNALSVSFVSSSWDAPRDATGWHSALPRAMRKTLRLPNKSPKPRLAHTDLTETFRRDAYISDPTHNQNLEYLDRGYDFDEFQDIDDEFAGLTIVEPMDEAELFEFCTGYNIL